MLKEVVLEMQVVFPNLKFIIKTYSFREHRKSKIDFFLPFAGSAGSIDCAFGSSGKVKLLLYRFRNDAN